MAWVGGLTGRVGGGKNHTIKNWSIAESKKHQHSPTCCFVSTEGILYNKLANLLDYQSDLST